MSNKTDQIIEEMSRIVYQITLSENDLLNRIQTFLKNPTEDQKQDLIILLSKEPADIIKKLTPLFNRFPELQKCSVEALMKKEIENNKHIEILNSQIRLLDEELNEFLLKYNKIKENYSNVRDALEKIASEDENLEMLEDATSDTEVELIESRAKIIDLARKIVVEQKENENPNDSPED